MRPDYSPMMLRLFLRARVVAMSVIDGVTRDDARKMLSCEVRGAARVTHAEFDFAFVGRLENPAKRAAIWGAIGVQPVRELTMGD